MNLSVAAAVIGLALFMGLGITFLDHAARAVGYKATRFSIGCDLAAAVALAAIGWLAWVILP